MTDFESKYFDWPPAWLENFTIEYAYLPYIVCMKPTCSWASDSELDMRQAFLQMWTHWKSEHAKADMQKSPEREKLEGTDA